MFISPHRTADHACSAVAEHDRLRAKANVRARGASEQQRSIEGRYRGPTVSDQVHRVTRAGSSPYSMKLVRVSSSRHGSNGQLRQAVAGSHGKQSELAGNGENEKARNAMMCN